MDVISVTDCIRIAVSTRLVTSMKSLSRLNQHSQSHWYWQGILVIAGVFLVVALYYHHILGEMPCLMCIQVRLLMILLMLVSIIALIFDRQRAITVVAHLSIVAINAFFVERSYMLLGTERGFVFSDCGFDLGLPSWLALEDWLPWLFRVETPCGYTPEIILGITMAEALMVTSVLFLVFSFCVTLLTLLHFKRQVDSI